MADQHKTECAICGRDIEIMDIFNGEPMCQDCYHDPENEVFE